MKSLLETILSRKLLDPKTAIYNWLDEHGIKNCTLNDKGEVDGAFVCSSILLSLLRTMRERYVK